MYFDPAAPDPSGRRAAGLGSGGSFRRRHFKAAITGVLVTALTLLGCIGCGSDVQPTEGTPSGTLRVGTPMQVRQVNPLADYSYSMLAMLMTHDTLVRFDGEMKPLPQLAESWQVSPDGRRWRFQLRTDACWHDGRPVGPQDVKFTFDYLAAHHGASAWIKDLVREIRIDGALMTFDLAKPYSRFLINCGFVVRILPRHIWQPVANPLQPGDTAVTMGCGPFVFDGFDARRGVIAFRKNNVYYGAPPAVERIEFLLNRTFDTLTLSLVRGDIDMYYKYASGFPGSHLPRLERTPGIQLRQAAALGVPAALGFNLKKGPGTLPGFRRAIAAALDYGRISRSLLGAHGRIPDAGFIPPAFSFYLRQPALAYNPQRSRRLLAAAGCRNTPHGGNLALTLLVRADLEGTDALLPIIIHNLKAVGIALHIERVDLSTWVERVRSNRFDLVLFRTTPWGMVMDAGCGSGYFDSRRGGGGTLANVADPVFHALCDRVLEITDAAQQLELNCDIQQYYADHLPAVALCWAVNAYPALERWQGLTVNQIEGGLLNRQTLAGFHPAPLEFQP